MRNKGFTLVELLVVIAIIALLLAILMPALQKVREQGRAVVCLANIRSISTAWTAYTVDSQGMLVGSWDGYQRTISGDFRSSTLDWVDMPFMENGKYCNPLWTGPSKLKDEQRGIKRGKLWSYLNNVSVYHCPSDQRYRGRSEAVPSKDGGYRSYSLSGAMNGDWVLPKYAALFKRYNQVTRPSDRLVCIEMMDRRGPNQGPFWVEPGDLTYTMWINTPGIYHNKITGIGFADGHGEMHKWLSSETVKICSQQRSGAPATSGKTKDDLLYLHKIFGYSE